MAPRPDNRYASGDRARDYAGHEAPDPGFERRSGQRSRAGYSDPYSDAERMRRAQADFDYALPGEGRWDERLGGYRYTQRDYPDERYGATGQPRPQGGADTTGEGYFGHPGWGGRHDEPLAGPHRGRGPAGYRRSDERIRDDVNDRLTDDPLLDATGVQVRVTDCEVTLDGTVNSRACKRRAEALAEEVSGVAHVQNNLRIGGSPPVG